MFITLSSILFIIGFAIIRFSKSNDQNDQSLDNNSDKRKESQLNFINLGYLPARNFQFFPYRLNADKDSNNNIKQDKTRTIVLLFAWLFAQQRHLDKYRKLYLDRGYDVLTIRADLLQVLFPTLGAQVIMSQLIDFLRKTQAEYDQYFCHAFSIGAYVMGEGLVQLSFKKNENVRKILFERIKGTIIDSAVDVEEGPYGLAEASTSNPILQFIIVILIKTYMFLNYPWATKHYYKSSIELHQNPMKTPLLIFLSKDDRSVNYLDQFQMHEKQLSEGIFSVLKCWEQSQHVSHYLKYPDEYRSTLLTFLDKVKIKNDDNNNDILEDKLSN